MNKINGKLEGQICQDKSFLQDKLAIKKTE